MGRIWFLNFQLSNSHYCLISILWLHVSTLGLTQWHLNSFEFNFDSTRLSSWYENKIGPIKKKKKHFVASWCCSVTALLAVLTKPRQTTGQRPSRMQQTKIIRPILFLHFEESLASSILNSKLLRLYCAQRNVHSSSKTTKN